MPLKRDLGKRYTCHACGCRYYDLNREDPRCPKCDANPKDDPTPDPRLAAMAKIRAESAGRGRAGYPDGRAGEFEEEFDADTFEDDDASEVTEDDEALDGEEEYEDEDVDDDF